MKRQGLFFLVHRSRRRDVELDLIDHEQVATTDDERLWLLVSLPTIERVTDLLRLARRQVIRRHDDAMLPIGHDDERESHRGHSPSGIW
jgi:hypothetical protein